MTLKARIIALYYRGAEYAEIAEALGCSTEYCRAAISRFKHGGRTPGDYAQLERAKIRWATDEEFRAANAARARRRRREDPRVIEKERARNRAWYAANKEWKRATERARYARKKAEREAQKATALLGGSRAVGDSLNNRAGHSETN